MYYSLEVTCTTLIAMIGSLWFATAVISFEWQVVPP